MFILLIVVMVFGADKLPDIAKGMGKGMRQLRDATNDIKGEITKNVNGKDVNDNLTKDITNEINKVKDELEDVTGSVKRKM